MRKNSVQKDSGAGESMSFLVKRAYRNAYHYINYGYVLGIVRTAASYRYENLALSVCEGGEVLAYT